VGRTDGLTRRHEQAVEGKTLRERLQAEIARCKALEVRLDLFSQVVEQSPHSIIITDIQGRIEYVNPSFTRISGYSADEAVGRTPSLIKSQITPRSVHVGLWRTIGAGATWRGELCNKTKDGDHYWDEVVISPIQDAQGRVVRYLAIQTNITARKATEEQLRESEARTRAIVEAAAEGIFTLDGAGAICSFNRAAERTFAYGAEEVIGQGIDRLLSATGPQETAGFLQYLRSRDTRLFEGGREFVGTRKDGSRFSVEVTVSEFHDGVGPYYAAIARDITERKRMETALREERNFVSTILATSAAHIVVLDARGRIVRFNRACEEATGYRLDEVKGEVFWERFLLPVERAPVSAAFGSPRAGQFPNQFESYLLTRGGERRLISWNNTAVFDRDGNVEYIVGTGIDITEQRRAQAQAQAHQASLAHMDRLSLMGEMATGLAHELNQPLTSIYAYAQGCLRMLHGGDAGSERIENALQQIARLAEQAGGIIRRLRDFVRRRGTKRISVDVGRLIEEAIEFIKTESRERGVTIELDLSVRLPQVLADPVQIEQVVLNLMRNAIEAMMLVGTGERVLGISASPVETGDVLITVEDTGPGLDKAQIDQIFDAFHTTKAEGMGMGLAISRSIVESHGGRLWAEAGGKGGAVFRFTLPAIGA
jgi:PAS domain S-box-containing protein